MNALISCLNLLGDYRVLSGIGGWAGIGIAAGLPDDTEDGCGLGACGAYRSLSSFTKLGGTFSVFALPK